MPLTAEQLEACLGPLDHFLGVSLLEGAEDRAVARLEVSDRVLHPGGLVDGGVYATLAELVASVGANVALPPEESAVGGSNHTYFLRAVREGVLEAVATPIGAQEGRQVWEVRITDEQGRLVAYSCVQMVNLSHARYKGTPT